MFEVGHTTKGMHETYRANVTRSLPPIHNVNRTAEESEDGLTFRLDDPYLGV